MITTDEFLSHKNLALVRLSAQTPVMGDMKKELVQKGCDTRSSIRAPGPPTHNRPGEAQGRGSHYLRAQERV